MWNLLRARDGAERSSVDRIEPDEPDSGSSIGTAASNAVQLPGVDGQEQVVRGDEVANFTALGDHEDAPGHCMPQIVYLVGGQGTGHDTLYPSLDVVNAALGTRDDL